MRFFSKVKEQITDRECQVQQSELLSNRTVRSCLLREFIEHCLHFGASVSITGTKSSSNAILQHLASVLIASLAGERLSSHEVCSGIIRIELKQSIELLQCFLYL